MDAGRWSEAVAEREELMEAPGSGDAVAVGEVWDRHLRHAGETVAARPIARTRSSTARVETP